jgi:hypothetical protein
MTQPMSCCAGNIEFEEDELARRDGEDDNVEG